MLSSKIHRIPSLDGLRAIAIGLVLMHHGLARTDLPILLQYIHWMLGRLGVQLFFVISGFLITRLLLIEKKRTGSISLRGFYFRRALRIFPAFYVFLAIVALTQKVSAADLAIAAVYLSDLKQLPWPVLHTWSLSIEEQFYLLWPFALKRLRDPKELCALIMIAAPISRVAWCIHSGPLNMVERFRFEWSMDCLAAGCLIALNFHHLKGLAVRANPALLSTGFLAGLVGALALDVRSPLLGAAMGVSLTVFCIAALVLLAIVRPPLWLNMAGLGFIGRISYSLYLYQQFFSLNKAFPFGLWLPVSIAAAYASYRLIEKPALELKHSRWAQRLVNG